MFLELCLASSVSENGQHCAPKHCLCPILPLLSFWFPTSVWGPCGVRVGRPSAQQPVVHTLAFSLRFLLGISFASSRLLILPGHI